MKTKKPMSFQQVIDLWPNCPAMALDMRISDTLVRSWHQRNRIPDYWWERVLRAARKRRFTLTAEMLVALAAKWKLTR